MPDLYLVPKTGLASATQGFLSSFKDFRRLSMEEKAQKTRQEEEAARLGEEQRQFDASLPLQEQQASLRERDIALGESREARLAQPFEPSEAALRRVAEMRVHLKPGAHMLLQSAVSSGEMTDEELMKYTSPIIDKFDTRQWKKDKWAEVLDKARGKLDEEGVPEGEERFNLEMMLQSGKRQLTTLEEDPEYDEGPPGDPVKWWENFQLEVGRAALGDGITPPRELPAPAEQVDQPGESRPASVEEVASDQGTPEDVRVELFKILQEGEGPSQVRESPPGKENQPTQEEAQMREWGFEGDVPSKEATAFLKNILDKKQMPNGARLTERERRVVSSLLSAFAADVAKPKR